MTSYCCMKEPVTLSTLNEVDMYLTKLERSRLYQSMVQVLSQFPDENIASKALAEKMFKLGFLASKLTDIQGEFIQAEV